MEQAYKFSQIQNVKMPANSIWDEETGQTVWAAHQWLGPIQGTLRYSHLSLSCGRIMSNVRVGGHNYILDVFATRSETEAFLERWNCFWWNRSYAESNKKLSEQINSISAA